MPMAVRWASELGLLASMRGRDLVQEQVQAGWRSGLARASAFLSQRVDGL